MSKVGGSPVIGGDWRLVGDGVISYTTKINLGE